MKCFSFASLRIRLVFPVFLAILSLLGLIIYSARGNYHQAHSLILLTIVALLAFGMAWFGMEVFILRPVNRLLGVTKLLRGGDLTARVGAPYGRGELARLAQSLDQMAEALELRAAEPKEIDRALQSSEERYRRLFELSRDAIYMVARDGMVIDGNQATCEMFGYTKNELIGKNVTTNIYFNPSERNGVLKEIGKKGFIRDYEVKLRKKNGTVMDCLLSSIARTVDEGVTVYQGIARDITESKRAVTALRESEERYRSLFEQCRDAVYIVAQNGTVIDVNQTACDMYGYGKDELIGQDVNNVYADPLDRPKMLKEIEKNGFVKDYELKGRKKDGTIIDCLLTTTLQRASDGSIVGNQGIVRDVSERKRTEKALRESEEKYRAIFEQSWDAIYLNSSVDGKLLDCNQSFLDLFGYNRAELDKLGVVHLYVNPELRPGLIQEIRTKGFIKDREVKCRRKDGTEIDCLITVNVRKDREGRIVGHQGVARDITERKRAEERIRRESARTEALVHVASRINSQLDLQQVLKAICQETAQALNVSAAKLSLYDQAEEMFHQVANYGIPPELWKYLKSVPKKHYDRFVEKYGPTSVIPDIQLVPDIYQTDFHTRANTRTEAFLAIERNGTLIGGLTVMIFGAERHFDDDDLTLLKGLADQSALAISNAQLFEQLSAGCKQLQILSGRLVEVQETERRQIACELHDEIGQSLTGLKLFIESSMRLPGDRARSSLKEAQKLIHDLMGQVEEMALNLRPSMLDDLGITATLLWHFQRYTSQTNVYVNFKHHGLHERRFKPEIETATYRIVQESLTNVARHASVGKAEVRLGIDQNMLVVEIEDHGRGFAPHLVRNSCGLSGMRERAMLLGGFLRIESSPGSGTCLTARLPLGEPN